MGIFRDSIWQGISGITSVIALLLYIYVEREKIFPPRSKDSSIKHSPPEETPPAKLVKNAQAQKNFLRKIRILAKPLIAWVLVISVTLYGSATITAKIFPLNTDGFIELAIIASLLGLANAVCQWFFLRKYSIPNVQHFSD